VRAASREIDAVVQALKRQTSALATRDVGQPRLSTGDQGSLRAHARAAVDNAAARALDADVRSPRPEVGSTASVRTTEDRPASVGDRVLVPPFGLEGVVKTIAGGQAEVDVNGKRLRASAKALRVMGGQPVAVAASVRVHVDLAEREGSISDLNVIGCTVDEALDKAGRFLDDTLVTDQRTVRVIHGHGTGRLQKAIAGFLKSHPLVANFHAAPLDQGGAGVTVVELKD
jgi:DNA mismatch repair protein MutS2